MPVPGIVCSCKSGKDTVPFVLWVLRTQAGQVGLVTVQSPRVKAPSFHLAPIRTFLLRAEVAVRAQKHLGCAVEGSV